MPVDMPKGNWQRAVEEQTHARAEDAKRIRKELGLSTTDRELEKRARDRAEQAARKNIRDRGEG